MPQPLTGLRIATSYLTPVGVETQENEIDFQLGAQEGIEIFSAIGSVAILTDGPTTAFLPADAHQSLHLRTGTLETIPDGSGEDASLIDSSIFYIQDVTILSQDEAATRGGSAAAMLISPQGLVPFPEPVFSSQNLTHQARSLSVTWHYGMRVVIFYRFVKFTLAELGLILARRQ